MPVLSEQITVVQPSVSTLGNFLTIAFRFAIFLQGANAVKEVTSHAPCALPSSTLKPPIKGIKGSMLPTT